MKDAESGVYQERYGWTRRTASVTVAGALFVAVSIGVTIPLAPTLALFGAGALALLWAAQHRRVALRVDETGITLGGKPLRYHATRAQIPWSEIVAVVVWQQILTAGGVVSCVGVERRHEAQELPKIARGGWAPDRGLVPDIPASVLQASRAAKGWRLDRGGLAQAVASFAPNVLVVDLGTGNAIPGES